MFMVNKSDFRRDIYIYIIYIYIILNIAKFKIYLNYYVPGLFYYKSIPSVSLKNINSCFVANALIS